MLSEAQSMSDAAPLICYPVAFEALTGLCPDAFAELVADVRPAVTAADEAKRNRPARVRAPGAGRKHRLTVPDRVFAALLVSRFGSPEADAVGYVVGASRDTVLRAARLIVPAIVGAGHGEVCTPLSATERRARVLTACHGLPAHGGLLRYLAMRCGLLVADDGSVVTPNTDVSALGLGTTSG